MKFNKLLSVHSGCSIAPDHKEGWALFHSVVSVMDSDHVAPVVQSLIGCGGVLDADDEVCVDGNMFPCCARL